MRAAELLETSPIVRIVVRLNQCLPALALTAALTAGYFAYQGFVKSREDKRAEAWRVLLSASGKKVNYGQVAAIEKLHHEGGASFSYIELTDSVLRSAQLEGADFSHANFAGTDLSGAKLRKSDFRLANLVGTNLSKTDLTQVEFDGADLSRANLSGAIVDVRIIYAKTLEGVDLSDTRFVYGDDEDEDGERWASFSDTMGEDSDRNVWQRKIDRACVRAGHPANFGPLNGELHSPTRQCALQREPRTR